MLGLRSLLRRLSAAPRWWDVNSDYRRSGLENDIVIDRDTTARLGISPLQIDNTLYDAFGQRQVSVIYSAFNQYHCRIGIFYFLYYIN